MIQLGILLALLCALATNVGFLLKHRGACAAPDVSLRHPVRSAVGLWYGWKQMGLKEVVALHKAKKECKVPALYFSGHEAFTDTR